MTPQEIADHLLAQTTLTEETMEPLHTYKREKRATGAPVDLECAILDAARACEDVRGALAWSLVRVEQEAKRNLAALAEHGARFSVPTWLCLDGPHSAAEALIQRRAHFKALVEAWAAIADRIVATEEDRARRAAKKRARAIALFATKPVCDLRALAKHRGLKVKTGRVEIATALVDAGVMPDEEQTA